MRVAPKTVQTFRNDFTYTNSANAVARFPFPFPEDQYRYSVNIEPHVTPGPEGTAVEFLFDIDEHYLSEMAERNLVLTENPKRCMTMPHMDLAAWDMLERCMQSLAQDYPEYFSLQIEGDEWSWTNNLLDIRDSFTFGNSQTLPLPPLEYIGRQVQGDFTLLDQREGDLFLDAGILTCPADWSLAFDMGMSFSQWHGPVPLAHEMGVFDRALKYLTALSVGRPVRRLNWTLTVNPRMDTSAEKYPEWAPDKATLTSDNIGQKLHLRVELQVLDRMPRSNAIMFSIRTYLISFEDLTSNEMWAKRMHRVLKGLPPELVEYKGMLSYHALAVDWLAKFDHDDG